MSTRTLLSQRFSALFIVLFVLVDFIPVQAEGPAGTLSAGGDLLWAKRMGGTSDDYGNDMKVDSNGNVYMTGTFQGIVDFDPGPGITNLTSAGFFDIFISKTDSSGNFVWAKRVGGMDYDQGFSIAIDSSGNVYTTGVYNGTVDFDPGAGTYNLTDVGYIFVSKLDGNGNFVWAKRLGSGESYSITVDSNSNVYTTGFGSGDFDPGAGIFNLPSIGSNDIFVSKLDSNGNFVWAKGMGGTGIDDGNDIAVDSSSNVYISGDFQDTVDFDPSAGTTNLTSAGSYDIFLAKLNSSGNLLWAKRTGGTGDDIGFGIALDSNNNVYRTGAFSGTADFDPGAGTTNLTSGGNLDIFVSKLDSSGNLIWAKGMGSSGTDMGGFIALDSSANSYIGGGFIGTVDFDPGAGTTNLTSKGLRDLFAAKFDGNGNFVWAKALGGASNDYGLSIDLDGSGNVYTAGGFTGTTDFDPSAGTYNLSSAGEHDIFISKLQGDSVFGDVPSGYWAQDFIERLYAAGITGGCSVNPLQYCPEGTVTRAQMAVFLERGIHSSSYNPPAVGGSTGFGDVTITYWAAAWIKQLAAEGITGGCGSGNYCPEAAVTRAQMAIFLLRSKYGSSYSPPAVGVSTGFSDVDPAYWAGAWIKQLVAEGITAGCGTGTYCPELPVTRAQMAVFLVRTFNFP